jgi:hypothetical protein
VLIGRTVGKRQRKVLGIKLPGAGGGDLSAVARGVSDAGKQIGKLASEVNAARLKAEEVGKALR